MSLQLFVFFPISNNNKRKHARTAELLPSGKGVGKLFPRRARFGKTVEAAGRTALIRKQGEEPFFFEITVHVRM